MSEYGSLVLGASGFLGSHVVKNLVEKGQDVRVMVRRSSSTRAIKDLDLISYYGDVTDRSSLIHAMEGCDTVYYCVVDTRVWLKDTTPLWDVNVEGLRNALDAAVDAGVRRFVFTSSIVTIGRNDSGRVNELDAFNWQDMAPEYALCRVQAENMLFEYYRDKGLPAIAMCIANTYGPGDYEPTPHGELVKNVALHRMPLAIDCASPVVDIRDAAEAMVLAADKGVPGERYIISTAYANQVEMYRYVAKLAGVKPPSFTLSVKTVTRIARVVQTITGWFGVKPRLNTDSVLLSHIFNDMDNTKARKALGWSPRPFKETVKETVAFYLAEHKARRP